MRQGLVMRYLDPRAQFLELEQQLKSVPNPWLS